MARAGHAGGHGTVIRDIEPTYARLGLEAQVAPESEYLSAVMGESMMTLPTAAIARWAERFAEDSPDPMMAPSKTIGIPGYGTFSFKQEVAPRPLTRLMDPAEANLTYGHLGLKFTAPVREGVAELMAESKRREAAYRQVYERARIDGNLSLGAKALGVAGEFLVQAADPLNVASAFIPVVAQARWAQWALGMGIGPARLARGAIEGAVGAAMLEPLLYATLTDEQLDYNALNSFMNIVFGAGLGGGLHWLGGYGRDLARGAWRREDLVDMAAGRPLVSDPVTDLDSPSMQRIIEISAREEARGAFTPPAAARRAEAEARGEQIVDYTMFATPDGSPPIFRSRYESPEPWGQALEALAPETRENIVRTAVAQALDDRKIDVEPVARVDPAYVEPPPQMLRWLQEASPAALRWALEETPQGFRVEKRKFGQRIPRSLLPTRTREAALRETKDHARIMEIVRESLAELGVVSDTYRGFSAPLLTAPGGFTPSRENMRVAMILKGEEKAPGTLLDWVKEQGGVRDDGGELRARDVRQGRKGVPPGLLRKLDKKESIQEGKQAGLLLADLARLAVEDGWIPDARKADDWEANVANQDYLPTDRMADMIAEAMSAPLYHPDSDYPAAKARADDFGELLAEHGLDAKDFKAADLAYLADSPHILGELQEWRYVSGLLDEVQSEDVALRLWDEIERTHVEEMTLAIEMYRADTGRERPEGFEPDVEGDGPLLTHKEWEALSGKIDEGLAEYEGAIARAGARERDEGSAVVVAADDQPVGKGGAADDGKAAAAGEAREGAGAGQESAPVERSVKTDSKVLAEGETPPIIDIGDMVNMPWKRETDVKGFVIYKVTRRPDGSPRPGGYYELFRDGQSVGHAMLRDNNRQVGGVVIAKETQGQGLGKMLYAAIERDIGAFLTPTETLTEPGKALWASYVKSQWRRDVTPDVLAAAKEAKAVAVEKTDQGMQTVLPGAERITPEEMNARIVAKGIAERLTASVKQDAGFGLFDVQGRGQADLLNATAMSDVEALVRKYGRDPEGLVQRLEEMRGERGELSQMAGGGERLKTIQKRIADGEQALAEIQRRDQVLREQSEPFIARQGSKEADALIEPKNELNEAYAKVVDEGSDEVALKAEVERLETEMGDRVTAEERQVMNDLDRQASDFEAAGMAYLVCKAGDGS